MAREVKNRISLDASRFTRGTNTVRRNIRQLERGLTIDMAKATRIARRGILAVGAAGTAIGVGIAAGVKSVINLGAELDHLSSQTGIAVRDLMILRQAFDDNGVSADQVGRSVNRMQKAMIDANNGLTTSQRAFDALGLSVDELMTMDTTRQFEAIGQAISRLPTQAEQAAVAMDIFGRSGAQMLAVFQEGAIQDAADSLGEQAQLLEKNSVIFERAGTLLDRAGTKVRGFFVGIADQVVPVILPLLEKFDQLDLAGQGQRFGEGLQSGLQAVIGLFQNNQFGKVIGLSLQIAGKEFINIIARGWTGILSGIGQAMRGLFDDIISNLTSGFKAVLFQMQADILNALGALLQRIPGAEGTGNVLQQRAMTAENKAIAAAITQPIKSLSEVVSDMSQNFQDGMADMDGFNILDTEADKNALRQTIADALRRGAEDRIGPEDMPADQRRQRAAFDMDDMGVGQGRTSPAVSSLAAIGGGGGVGGLGGIESLVDQSQRQTGILRNINDGIKNVSKEIRDAVRVPSKTVAILA